MQKKFSNTDFLTEIATIYKILGNVTRLKILYFLMTQANPVNVSTIVQNIHSEQPIVSKQLGILYHYQLVDRQRQGVQILYQVSDPHIVELLADMFNHVQHEIKGQAHPFNAKN
ncbi:metalloregulator ArsR/SmtB family transcription factor [Bombilactobacillus folatiphilus]|uniref:Metalloregulator ArsR/SmtB family transcription factor n=1 Tax=Bombilactobacillus folatiphilus TaxID=2923362 RepID=A0ABY4P7A2_9LACO|nr:metalloregulator ArsR/SmtB family transcription factor [Bombilactobacillus folatiphilus]UQS81518.1 metalloregulator ArsR/SmtB family transcription factor [Bombilactobacillus folatiphilus]